MDRKKDEDRWLDEALARVRVDVPAGAAERIMATLYDLPPQRLSARERLAGAWTRLLGGLEMPAWSQAATLATATALGVLVGLSNIGAVEPPSNDLMAFAFDASPVPGEEP
ncbi:MAG: hypothetical protein EXQ86_07720 [Rhodospirillales bacterium]|nr:hypothetical protein [Rhodospirillales bacterium]